MGGKGSGRSGWYDKLDFEELVKKSLTIQLRFFDDPKIPDEKKVEYASRYLAKRVGERIDIEVTHQIDEVQLDQLSQRCIEAIKSKNANIIDIETKPTS